MAQAVFAGLPVLILYLFFQRHIVSAVAGGGGAILITKPKGGTSCRYEEELPGLLSAHRRRARGDCSAGPAAAQPKTEITFARFFGACESDYGTSQDVAHARGECGVMTTLVNLFNATNKDNIVVKPQIIEWGRTISN